MKANPFKSLQCYAINNGIYTALRRTCSPWASSADARARLEERRAEDPSGTQRSTLGLVPPEVHNENLLVQLEGCNAIMLVLQFADRILPSTVRDDSVNARAAILEKNLGRPLTKKARRDLRNEVELDLLPRAFIRRSKVYVMVFNHHVAIFTASSTKADMIAAFMIDLLADRGLELKIIRLQAREAVAPWLTALARSNDDSPLEATSVAVLRAADPKDKSVVRIKDRDILSDEVQTLLYKGKYLVSELGVMLMPNVLTDVIEGLRFTLTQRLAIKNLRFAQLTEVRAPADQVASSNLEFHAFAQLTALTVTTLITLLFAALGGEAREFFDEYEARAL